MPNQKAQKIQTYQFTIEYNSVVNALISEVIIAQAFDPSTTQERPPHKKFKAIWDTGATGSVISKRVVEECQLKPIGMAIVQHADGSSEKEVYLVNMVLPNQVGVSYLRVTEGNLGSEIDVLIGMDIIKKGDFAITNRDGKTVFTFRMPSIERIDFVGQQPIRKTQKKIGRNDPCPCGSGKKYKKCCGLSDKI